MDTFPLRMGNKFLSGRGPCVSPGCPLTATFPKVAQQHCSKRCPVYHRPYVEGGTNPPYCALHFLQFISNRCIPNRILIHYSMMFCSVNSASSAFTLKFPKRKVARKIHLNNRKTKCGMLNTSSTQLSQLCIHPKGGWGGVSDFDY